MVRWKVRVGTADNLELFDPVHADGSEQPSRSQEVRTEVDVVDDALEVVRIVAIEHLTLAVGVLELELVHQLRFPQRRAHARAHGGTEPRQEPLVAVVLQVSVVDGDTAVDKVLDHAGVGEGVEISAGHYGHARSAWDSRLESDPLLVLCSYHDAVQLVHQHDGLDELDVSELRVPVDVGVGH